MHNPAPVVSGERLPRARTAFDNHHGVVREDGFQLGVGEGSVEASWAGAG